MEAELAALADLKRQVQDLARLIQDSRTPSGVRKRATRAVCDLSIRALTTAEEVLRAAQRQAQAEREEELV